MIVLDVTRGDREFYVFGICRRDPKDCYRNAKDVNLFK